MGNCIHKSTGSMSPGGVYMYVSCMDCREILAESELGKKLRETCPGWDRRKYEHHCKHCHHDADHHIELLTARLRIWEESCTGKHGSQMQCSTNDRGAE
jgi:hypothetical protein